jgi:hypothetical protein
MNYIQPLPYFDASQICGEGLIVFETKPTNPKLMELKKSSSAATGLTKLKAVEAIVA